MALPPRDQRHQYLRYEGLQYTDADIADFETRLARIYRREIHKGYSRAKFGEVILDLDTPRAIQFQLGRVRRRMSWRDFILALGLHSAEEMHNASFSLYWTESARWIPDKGDLRDY
ncbi:hypothetical protein Tco_1080574 [Tanacetum coccineum]|uniref:Uncharacterized protein n=1 Tax=Tanacetum coccineum TaxID=301880 RepID=A0ABQ5HVZ9_9ASTR